MSLRLPLPRGTSLGLSAAVAVSALAVSTPAQEATRPGGPGKAARANPAERASGVIVKVEPIAKGAAAGSSSVDDAKRGRERGASRRLTINTAAVWRDWVRDQAADDPATSPGKAAEKGANSVAAKGEPQDPDTLVVVDIGPDTKVETRYRASTDETSKGARTPAEARAGAADPAEKTAPPSGRSKAESKVLRFSADDLKPGLFIEADFRRATAQNLASTVAVIRPVGGPDTPANK